MADGSRFWWQHSRINTPPLCIQGTMRFAYTPPSMRRNEKAACSKEGGCRSSGWASSWWRSSLKAWLQDALEHGCWSWDLKVSKPLSAVLLSSQDCRLGEVIRSDYHTSLECFTLKRHSLEPEGGEANGLVQGEGRDPLRKRIHVMQGPQTFHGSTSPAETFDVQATRVEQTKKQQMSWWSDSSRLVREYLYLRNFVVDH